MNSKKNLNELENKLEWIEKTNKNKTKHKIEAYETLKAGGVDDVLAKHIGHLWIRDPLGLFCFVLFYFVLFCFVLFVLFCLFEFKILFYNLISYLSW